MGQAARVLYTTHRLSARVKPTQSQPALTGTLRTSPEEHPSTGPYSSFGSDTRESQRFHESLLPPGVDHRNSSLGAIRGPQVTC